MSKEFDLWNNKKKVIHSQTEYLPLYHERQIRWCQLGVNIGYEQDGAKPEYSRPVLILKIFSRFTCLVIPLTTSMKQNLYHVALGKVGGKEAFAIVSQLRLIDTKRLDQMIATLSKEVFEIVRKTVRNFF